MNIRNGTVDTTDSLFGGGAIGIVNNVFKLILLVTKLTLLSCCVLRL